MKRQQRVYLAVPFILGMLFWDSTLAVLAMAVLGAYLLWHSRFVRAAWKHWRVRQAQTSEPSAPADPEPTLITLVARAPYQLLGIDHDAGTSTIFNSFYEKVKDHQGDGLRLNKEGRRLTAAKNRMMQEKRKRDRPASPTVVKAQKKLESSLHALLADRPVHVGEVVRFLNLSPAVAAKYQVGTEIEEGSFTAQCGNPEEVSGRGNSRFVIRSQSGRLLSGTGEAQVAFLPGTRFLVVSRQPWHNPDQPDADAGFTLELEEVA